MPFLRFLFLAIMLLPVLTPPAGARQVDPDLETRIRGTFGPLAESRDFSGAIAFCYGDGPVSVIAFGYADWQTGRAFFAGTPVPAGAVTDSLTRVLAQRLVDTGRLSPADPLRRYLPGAGAEDSVAELLDPETRSDTRLIEVIEQAARARFETFAATEILGPLGLDNSRITRRPAALAVLAEAYEPGPRPLDLRPAPLRHQNGSPELVTTAPDLTRLAQAVLSRRIDLFRANGSLMAGWRVIQREGEVIYTVTGSQPGYSAGVSILAGRELAIAYVANIDSFPTPRIDALLQELALGGRPAVVGRPATAALEPGHFDALGQYDSAVFGSVSLVQSGSGLDLVLPQSGRRDHLTPIGPGRLFWRRAGAELAYERDEAGRVTALTGRRVTPEPGMAIRLERTGLPPLAAPSAADPAD
jgi:CubicO group peptidase (beta-lactamase class C family)